VSHSRKNQKNQFKEVKLFKEELKMKKTIVLLLVIVFLVSMISIGTSCKEKLAKEAPVTIVWWDWQSGGDDMAPIKAAAEEYKKLHPNFTFKRKTFGYGDYNIALKTALVSGEAPDIFQVHPGAPSRDLVNAGQLLDLTDIITGDADWSSWIEPALKVKDSYIDGRIYYVPIDMNHLPVVYWIEMFESRNLEVPTTLNELYEVADALNDDGIIPMVSMFAEKWVEVDFFTVFVRTADETGDLIERANIGEASWENPLFKQAMQSIVNLYNNGVFPTNILELGWGDCLDMFNKKKAAMCFPIGQFGLTSLDLEPMLNGEISDFPLPQMDKDGKLLYTGGCSIVMAIHPALAPEVQQTCIDFAKFLNGPVGQELLFDSFRSPPGSLVTKESDNPLFDKQTRDQNTMEIGYRYIDNPDIYQAVTDGVVEAILGEDIDSIMAKIEAVSQSVNR